MHFLRWRDKTKSHMIIKRKKNAVETTILVCPNIMDTSHYAKNGFLLIIISNIFRLGLRVRLKSIRS